MPTEVYKLNIPDSLAREINTANQDLLIELLERGLHSFGAAAQKAGVSQAELARHAYARDMEPPFSEETLSEELS